MKIIPTPLEFNLLKNPPKKIFAKGDTGLLSSKRKIAIVGTRKPNPYARVYTQTLAKMIAKNEGVVVSGGALGIDIIAHSGAFPRTIMIAPTDLEHIYPSSNAKIISTIYSEALALSEYENISLPRGYHFLQRNRLVIALSDCVIIPQADLCSGSMQSARIAIELKKPLYVLPHRLGESEGTNALLADREAKAIYCVNEWIKEWFEDSFTPVNDEVLKFCERMPSFEEAYERFGEKIYEYEFEGKIKRNNGILYVL
ncbi:DNA-processing protein DprA [Helicobacter cholecystus]|uniref:DNA-processing protein DprA n=1 Tax=Helicobacter cholecystus TaxID=45498 RepID=UPI0027386AD5|nr:DNA-processing protein DprA [Helicobacter cholecystus]